MTSLRLAKATLDVREFHVEAHRVDCGQIGFFGLDDIFAFVRLLAGEVDGVLEEAKNPVLI